jgi:anti-sigma factor RsiW
MEHPSQEVLLRFILGAASRQESRQVVRHLLARCPACAAAFREIRREPPLAPPPRPEAYDQAFTRAAAFLRALARKENPPPRLELDAAEADRRPGSATTAKAVRRPWLFG